METIRQVLESPVLPPSKIRRETPPELEALILKSLEKDKARRHPTAGAFVKALESISAPPPGLATPRPAPSPAPAEPRVKSTTKAIFWGIVLLILSVLAGLGVLQLIRGGPAPH
jgi:serine/threonine-protein kinase